MTADYYNLEIVEGKKQSCAPINSEGEDTEQSNYNTKRVYFNFTEDDLWIVERDNRRIHLPSEFFKLKNDSLNTDGNKYKGKLVIREYVNFNTINMNKMYEGLNYCVTHENDAHFKDAATFNRLGYNAFYYNSVFGEKAHCKQLYLQIDYLIEFNRKARNTFWIDEQDIIVDFTKEISKVHYHPFARGTRIKNAMRDYREVELGNTHFVIRFVDNDQKHNPRYFYIGNFLQIVEPVVSKGEKDGIYFIKFIRDLETDKYLQETEFYTLEEAEEKLGVFDSVDKAKNLGDLQLDRQFEIKAKQYELEEIRVQLEESKLEVEKQKQDTLSIKNMFEQKKIEQDLEFAQRMKNIELEAKKQKEHIEEELGKIERKNKKKKEELDIYYKKIKEKMDLKRSEMEDLYLRRSLERKDNSELVKFIPTMLVGALAIGLAILK